jgi:hypothetical protein
MVAHFALGERRVLAWKCALSRLELISSFLSDAERAAATARLPIVDAVAQALEQFVSAAASRYAVPPEHAAPLATLAALELVVAASDVLRILQLTAAAICSRASVALGGEAVGADALFPLVTHVIAHANLHSMPHALAAACEFGPDALLSAEQGFCLMTFQAAVRTLLRATVKSSRSVRARQFDLQRVLGPGVGRWIVRNLNARVASLEGHLLVLVRSGPVGRR